MTLAPWRILTAVPQTWQARLEIAKAIRVLQQGDDGDERQGLALMTPSGLAAQIVGEILQDLNKAGFQSDQPRWRKGSGGRSGRWSGGAGLTAAEVRERLKGGHHYVPRELFDKLFAKQKLREDTWAVFDRAVTGPTAAGASQVRCVT